MFQYRPPVRIEDGPEAWEKDLQRYEREIMINTLVLLVVILSVPVTSIILVWIMWS